MGKKDRDRKRRAKRDAQRLRRWLRGCEQRSDKRTAGFVARRLGEIQEDLADLLPDLRTFDHYREIEDIGWCLAQLQDVRQKYDTFVDRGTWEERW